jgi:translocation and assembly module TamB
LSGAVVATLDAEVRDLLAQPNWTANLSLTSVDLPRLVAEAPAINLSATLGSEGSLDHARITGKLTAEAPAHAEMGRLGAELDLDWQEQVLHIGALKLTEQGSGAMLDVEGRLDFADAQGQVALAGAWEALRWPLTGEARLRSPRGTLDVTGQLDAFAYSLAAEVFGQDIPQTRLTLSGEGDTQGARIGELRLQALGGQAVGKGRLSWTPRLAWELALTAQEIDPGQQWAGFDGRVGLKAESEGNLEQGYSYQVRADVGLRAYPSLVVNLSGAGTTAAAEIASLGIDTLGGRIQGQGKLAWAPQLAWDARLDLSDLDPGMQAPDWPGRLSGKLTSEGKLTAEGLSLHARLGELSGQLRGYPVKVTGLIELDGDQLRVREFAASSGATALSASGQAADTLAMDFSLRSPNLGELLPAAQGALDITGQLRGNTQAPRLNLSLQGRDLELQGQGIEGLTGEAELGLGADDPITASLTGSNLLLGGQRFTQLQLAASGTASNHRLTAALAGEALSAQLAFSGQQRAPGDYRGDLSSFQLKTAALGTWSLPRPAPLAIAGERIDAGPLCIRDGGGAQGSGGCARFTQSGPGRFDASLTLDRLDLGIFAPWMPPDLTLKGHAVADAAFAGTETAITGQARLRVPEGNVELDLPGDADKLVFSNADATLVANAGGLEAKLSVPLQELGKFALQARLPGFALHAPPALARQDLTGSVTLELRDLARVGELVPDISGFSGQVDADFRLTGTLGQPGLQGQARVVGVNFQVPLIGLAVTDANLTAEARASDRLEISGAAGIGGGQLRLSGSGTGAPQGWTFALKLAGDGLKVADTKEYFALLKTDLSADFGPQGGLLQGVVDVKQARITPRSIPAGTVSTSPDVVVEGQGGETGGAGAAPVRVNVELKLRDSVVIEAFGLRGNLRGSVRAIQEQNQPLLGDGQLEVIDGTYRLSGQFGLLASVGAPLMIEQGILVFAKTPLTNPGLVLRAQREGAAMTAGVRVLGTLKKPKLSFFSDSDPNMNDAEIVNYLLTGMPPKGDASDIDQSLSVGAYIAPKLFVEYESNLGDQADKVKLRYDLNNWIELQTETGETQGADIFFKFEN